MTEQIESLIRTIVEPLIDHPEEFQIELHDTEEFMEYHLILHPDDVGRIIGRKGRVIRAIRTIVYSVRLRDQKRSRIVIADDLNENEEE
ncbi:KH domain-containing protein [Facklamia sp. 7083-14-GEN3]|uniref:KH domain-containing protein n=1 Tax=Facklamia sp. 7083-14-GEN3 TaxID=2973478 RepID=UPI00215BA1BD|nr:KH domain-containing protein [Facklamia sp. 7083-14-GEN3]MCR8968767.1 KH domain-containing protein [Facklamia sp. 7083-14-GEN3]